MPYADQIDEYEARLTSDQALTTIPLNTFLAVPSPLDDAEGNRVEEIKKLIFEVFMDSFKGEI